MSFSLPSLCLVRSVSSHFDLCIRDSNVSIDVERAQHQHHHYVEILKKYVPRVHLLPALKEHPDCCFIEDTCVIIGDVALITQPGSPSRRGETASVKEALPPDLQSVTMAGDALLDGGDVMRVGNTLWVGLSKRTNAAGLRVLRELAVTLGLQVEGVHVNKGLHLKSACTVLDGQVLVYDPDAITPKDFPPSEHILLPVPEPLGANILPLGDTILVSSAAPATQELLSKHGHRIHTVDVSELHKGDGALTCLSLRIAPAQQWSP